MSYEKAKFYMLDFGLAVYPIGISALVVQSEAEMEAIDSDFDNTICYFLVSSRSEDYNFGSSDSNGDEGRFVVMLMRLDTNTDELQVQDYFSFGTHNLIDWNGDLTFTQHTYWGPIASIVVFDSTEGSDSILIFSVFDDNL